MLVTKKNTHVKVFYFSARQIFNGTSFVNVRFYYNLTGKKSSLLCNKYIFWILCTFVETRRTRFTAVLKCFVSEHCDNKINFIFCFGTVTFQFFKVVHNYWNILSAIVILENISFYERNVAVYPTLTEYDAIIQINFFLGYHYGVILLTIVFYK